jgi:predicted TIM-barrel fold metal-dependent hydrolase
MAPRARGITRRSLLAFAAATPSLLVARRAAAEPGAAFWDMHAHPVVNLRASQMPSAASLLSAMDARGIAGTLLSPPPTTRGYDGTEIYGSVELSAVVRQAPERLAFAAGGDGLNQMLQQTAASSVTAELLARFRTEALAIARAGAAAFAELGAEVFAAGKNMPGGHTHQTSPADHPFLLALAQIAADFAMPIGLHMEAIVAGAGQAENITGFERLLAANPRTRIVWLHAGWDRTGQRSASLMQTLLQEHPNLFMALKSDHLGNTANAPLEAGGQLKPDWLALLSAFPDRFVLGSDQFYDRRLERINNVRRIVDALPADLARQIGRENPPKIYRLTT